MVSNLSIIMYFKMGVLTCVDGVRDPDAHELLPDLTHDIRNLIKIWARPFLRIWLRYLGYLLIHLNVHIKQVNNISEVSETEIVVRYVTLRDVLLPIIAEIYLRFLALFSFVPWQVL